MSMRAMRKKSTRKRVSVALPRRISGSGAYKTKPTKTKSSSNPFLKSALRGGGALAGGALASYMGMPSAIGAGLGGLAGSILSKISGSGAYDIRPEILARINRNTILKPQLGDQIPAFGHLGDGTRIQHREYVGDILSSVDFSNNVFPVQIASSKTFPWASQLAPLYSQYKIMGMVFEFRSMYSDSVVSTSANASLGSLIGCCEYNANALPFSNSVQMQNALFAESVKPSNSVMFPIECDPYQTPSLPLYTALSNGYQNDLLANDQRLNSLGNFQIATVGNQTNGQNLGQLWVSYDIMLYKQQLDIPREVLRSAKYELLGHNDLAQYKPLGEVQTKVYDSIGLSFPVSLGNSSFMNFQDGLKGDFLVFFSHNGVPSLTGVSNIPYVVSTTNCTITPQLAGTAGLNTQVEATGLQIAAGNSNIINNCMFILTIPNENATASIVITSPLSTSDINRDPNYGDLIVVKIKN